MYAAELKEVRLLTALIEQGDASEMIEGPIQWSTSDDYALISHLGSGKV